MIEQKFAHLTPEERQVLEAASVEGAEFSSAVIATAVGRETIEIEEHCADLVRHSQFIQERERCTGQMGRLLLVMGLFTPSIRKCCTDD